MKLMCKNNVKVCPVNENTLIITKNYYNNFMTTQLDLEKAISKIFGDCLEPALNHAAEWQIFTPFAHKKTGETLLLKLVYIPSQFQTSHEIITKMKNRFKGILHPVSIFEVERRIEKTCYLVQGQYNLISVDSYIKLKQKVGEKVQQGTILRFLQFASNLEKSKYSEMITFDLDQIGITSDGNFVLTNYEMYFYPEQKVPYPDLNMDIRRMLSKMLNPQQLDLGRLYEHVELCYGENMLQVLQRCMSGCFRASEAATIISSDRNSALETTLTDSVKEQNLLSEEIQNRDSQTFNLQEGLLTNAVKGNKSYKTLIFLVIFVAILAAIGVITFKYLNPRPLTCNQAQFLDKDSNQCLSCSPNCETCEGQTQTMCSSCKQNQFLIKKSRYQKLGKCGSNCVGQLISQKVCIG